MDEDHDHDHDQEHDDELDWLGPPERHVEAPVSPLAAYQEALDRYDPGWLVLIFGNLNLPVARSGRSGAIVAELGDPKRLEERIARLEPDARLALSLFALTETADWPLTGLSHALRCLGADPVRAVRPLVARGLVAAGLGPTGGPVYDPDRLLTSGEAPSARLLAHPAVLSAARTVLPEGEPPPVAADPARQVRESDGLEPILRVAVVWQRVGEAPLRQTQQGTLYKRDRERLEDDPVLAGPIADAIEPLPDMPALWLALASGVGLLTAEAGSERVAAASPDFWAENAWHLPQMLAVRWLALRTWHEQGGMQQEGSTAELALPYARPAVLLWLAKVPEGAWVALDDLARHLHDRAPDWDRASFLEVPAPASASRARSRRARAADLPGGERPDASVLEGLVLGGMYQFGLVRVGEETLGGRRVVQLSALGRYLLALGPPPPPRPSFEHFLFVQPNFEIVAYRQGLTPSLVGQLSRFARWSRLGAALELKLTPESVYLGLEGGSTPAEMLDRLARHSSRPMPAGVAEAIRTWAGRRERVTYHAATTLVEFATPADLERALDLWPADARAGLAVVSDRLLLVENETAIPFPKFRLTGARDYRRPAEACVEIEPDGVTLTLDLARSDLLVDAELARFSDERPTDSAAPAALASPRRRFVVTPASLARGARNGVSPALLVDWYARRTGTEVPPAVRLMLLAAASRVPEMTTSRPLVLKTSSAEILNGLLQHPDTRPYLGERLGPTTVVIPEHTLESFQRALRGLGLARKSARLSPPAGETDAVT